MAASFNYFDRANCLCARACALPSIFQLKVDAERPSQVSDDDGAVESDRPLGPLPRRGAYARETEPFPV